MDVGNNIYKMPFKTRPFKNGNPVAVNIAVFWRFAQLIDSQCYIWILFRPHVKHSSFSRFVQSD